MIQLYFTAEENSIVFVYLISVFHSSVDGHLGYDHVLSIVNREAMKMEKDVSLWWG